MTTPRNFPPFLAEILFAPGQHTHSIGLVIVPTVDDMKRCLQETGFTHIEVEEAGGGDPRGACCFDHGAENKFGFLIFAEETLTPQIIVHECTHAAQMFVCAKVMTSATVQAKSEEDQSAYYEEAIAHTTELLFQQVFDLLYTATRRPSH